MTITLEIQENEAAFRYPEDHGDIFQALGDLLDREDDGRVAPLQYIAELRDLTSRHPEFIDGHAHLGFAFLEQDEPERALDACMNGLALGEKAIPPDFDGTIEWSHLDNRPFLRAAYGVVLCCLRLGQRQRALTLMEKMLAWNPNDNQGVRDIIGSEYLRAGETESARAAFEKEGPHYPPYRYELALLLLRENAHKAAATSLRHGFVENDYIAQILCGTPDPLPLSIGHSRSFDGPDIAQNYTSQYGDLWYDTPAAIAFLRWLHTHPEVMIERASVLKWREALFWEHDFQRRGLLLDREKAEAERIDDRLSEEIVVTRLNSGGRPVFPWLHMDRRSRNGDFAV